MLERCKWEKELDVYRNLVNTLVFTGNIYDQQVIIQEEQQQIRGFSPLELYLMHASRTAGYEVVLIYNPVEGFHLIQGYEQGCESLQLIEKTVEDMNTNLEEESRIQLTSKLEQGVRTAVNTNDVKTAATIIHRILFNVDVPVVIIMNLASRLISRPDDLDEDERMSFMYLQEGAIRAKKHVMENMLDSQGRAMVLQNQLYLIADKINDLPAWYYLSHPSLKIINIPKPDYGMREQIIKGYSKNLQGFLEATSEEQQKYIDTFVGSTDEFTVQDIVRVFQIAKSKQLSIHRIDEAVLLYKHGVQENPWLKLEATRVAEAEEKIKKRVLGQDRIIKSAVDIVKRAATGMSGLQHSSSSSKPRGILFLAGPTGTGKTELAKALTELVFLDERNMIRFDMSEYRQDQSDQRLLGAPPGYVGYEAGGQLTNAVKNHPFSVLLFDEIEKAAPSVLDKFLQILEDGRITDGRGETVYFRDCLIIFTSNLGITKPSETQPGTRIENVRYEKEQSYEVVHDKILQGVKDYFNKELGRPELLNRIGNNILVFDYIREEFLRPIIRKQIKGISNNLWADKQIRLVVNPKVEEQLFQYAAEAIPEGEGGRGIGNMIEEKLINPLARYVFDYSVANQSTINVEEIYETDKMFGISAKVV
ncbi:MAG: AAA family ATPase [Anaerostipes sp.]|jgi:ATP-dependent Clp protease ATP-binding subunit ClpA